MNLFQSLFFIGVSALIIGCGTEKKEQENYLQLEGYAQGTTFHINYKDSKQRDFSNSIDSILTVMDMSMSVYRDSSLVTFCNNADSVCKVDEHFLNVYWKSLEIYYNTRGNFDPTVKQLIDFWGFGGEKVVALGSIDYMIIDSLLQFTGIEKTAVYDISQNKKLKYLSPRSFEDASNFVLLKSDPRIKLDFNAIAQGYSVDVIAEFFDSKNIQNYLIEIGGELRVRGVNGKGEVWKVGIDEPIEEADFNRPLQAVVALRNKAIATSGNYRKFYEKDGVKYSHTISAHTGFPIQRQILSATVVADDCMTADAYATAFMVMGHKKAIRLLENNKELQVYLIYSDENGAMKTYVTPSLAEKIKEKPQG